MLALNLLPCDLQLFSRGRRRMVSLGLAVMALVLALCALRVGLIAWALLVVGSTEQLQAVEAEVAALRRQYKAHERAALRQREAHERDLTFDSKRLQGLLAFRLARCAVPDAVTLSAMHLRPGEWVWRGAAHDSRRVAEMLSRITQCCSVLRPIMTRMTREDLHGEMYEGFEVRIPIAEQARELSLCHEEALRE